MCGLLFECQRAGEWTSPFFRDETGQLVVVHSMAGTSAAQWEAWWIDEEAPDQLLAFGPLMVDAVRDLVITGVRDLIRERRSGESC